MSEATKPNKEQMLANLRATAIGFKHLSQAIALFLVCSESMPLEEIEILHDELEKVGKYAMESLKDSKLFNDCSDNSRDLGGGRTPPPDPPPRRV